MPGELGHLHSPDHDHRVLLEIESGDHLKFGSTSSAPVGSSTLSLLDPLVVAEGQAGEEEEEDDVEEHDQDAQLQTSAPLVGCAPATEDGKLVTLKSGFPRGEFKMEQKRGNLYFLKPADAGQRC